MKTLTWGGSLGAMGTNPCSFQSHAVARLPHLHDAGSHPFLFLPGTHPLESTHPCNTQTSKDNIGALGSSWSNATRKMVYLDSTVSVYCRDTPQTINPFSHPTKKDLLHFKGFRDLRNLLVYSLRGLTQANQRSDIHKGISIDHGKIMSSRVLHWPHPFPLFFLPFFTLLTHLFSTGLLKKFVIHFTAFKRTPMIFDHNKISFLCFKFPNANIRKSYGQNSAISYSRQVASKKGIVPMKLMRVESGTNR
jgi:hypothetical protein